MILNFRIGPYNSSAKDIFIYLVRSIRIHVSVIRYVDEKCNSQGRVVCERKRSETRRKFACNQRGMIEYRRNYKVSLRW